MPEQHQGKATGLIGGTYLNKVLLVDNLLISLVNISRPQSKQVNQSSDFLRFRLIDIPSFQQGMQIRSCFSGGSTQQNGFGGSALLVVWQTLHCAPTWVPKAPSVDTVLALSKDMCDGPTV